MTSLTLRQQEVLDLLIEYQRKHGFPPTTYELTGMLGCRSPNAAATHLKALERKGAIKITRGVSRGISITTSLLTREVSVNLNSIVKVKLYDVALRHLKSQHEENRIRHPGIFGEFVPPATDDDGYSAMTLWSLMSDLGQLCYCGGDVPFELKMVLED
ncbi:SOS-response repressor and protease LexA [Klebsiella michiganensis]|uniref:SOS-response repressor and protease LexA n=1 Tax=Klebsiella michiganensis TaxID=1134687 RepID=A0A2J5PYD0_9ENTR|nr:MULTISPECIES: SOS-response repressor and protease LexA [Klebsiella]DAT36284.1 MAG TPA: SOS regulatory protein LexA [Caudoviricetes sp.]AYZ19572.1 SOS-response repressor and protease LexA [Klebsiella sp. FDAARGOS_511]ELS4491579.1 SOS-response repressor and protease LexA [Klebsiella michiganensis]ELS4624576.1 SOS-response repressor and protease LexA [Klebsiella michiganensis]MCW9462134.1 SOS-response repressor and protease LexA [Klebsiella michiganensis]